MGRSKNFVLSKYFQLFRKIIKNLHDTETYETYQTDQIYQTYQLSKYQNIKYQNF